MAEVAARQTDIPIAIHLDHHEDIDEIKASIERQMQRVNDKLERWETVKKFAILDHELTVENDGVTANMKIRRSVVTDKYKDIVDGLYPTED